MSGIAPSGPAEKSSRLSRVSKVERNTARLQICSWDQVAPSVQATDFMSRYTRAHSVLSEKMAAKHLTPRKRLASRIAGLDWRRAFGPEEERHEIARAEDLGTGEKLSGHIPCGGAAVHCDCPH